MRWEASVSEHQRTTTESYDTVATEYLETTRDFSRGLEWVKRFADAVPAGSLVADLGSGPGRDTARLRSHGLNAFCLDLSLGMLRAGRLEYPASRVHGSLLALHLTVKLGKGAKWESSRYGSPRWFQYWSASELDRELDQAALPPAFSSEEKSSLSTWLVRLCRAA